MPPPLSNEFDDDNMIPFALGRDTHIEKEKERPIKDYNEFKGFRMKKDIMNAEGKSEVEQLIDSNEATKNKNIHQSKDEMIRENKEQLDPRDTNKDGEVSWGESFKGLGLQVKDAVSSAGGKVVDAGLEGGKMAVGGVKRVALAVADVDGDGDIDNADLGAGIRATGENLREASGLNDLGRNVKDSGDKATSQLIYVAGAVVLAYLLIKA